MLGFFTYVSRWGYVDYSVLVFFIRLLRVRIDGEDSDECGVDLGFMGM